MPPNEGAVAVLPPPEAQSEHGLTLWGTRDPNQIIARAVGVANALGGIIESKRLYTDIRGRKHVRVEGWTLLGSMLGVYPVIAWSRRVDGGWEARCEAKTQAGAVVGAAEAQCLADESNWEDRDDFALRSMAQTRATSKCLKLPLGFVMAISGYETTPAEEMTGNERGNAEREFGGGAPPVAQPQPTRAAEDGMPKPVPVSDEAPPAPAPVAAAAPTGPRGAGRPAEGAMEWTGKIERVTMKNGTNQQSGQAWTMYTIYGSDRSKFSTFDEAVADDARLARQQGVEMVISYTENRYGRKAEAIRPA